MWSSLGIGTKITIISIAAAVVCGSILGLFFSVEKIGYDKCNAKYLNAALKNQQAAHVAIVKQSGEYEKIRQKLQTIQGRDNPASSVVSLAIDSLPER